MLSLDQLSALSRLPELVRETFVDHVLLGMTYREIAGRDGVTESCVGLRCKRARKILRAELA